MNTQEQTTKTTKTTKTTRIIRRVSTEFARRLHTRGRKVGYSSNKSLEGYKTDSDVVKKEVHPLKLCVGGGPISTKYRHLFMDNSHYQFYVYMTDEENMQTII
jgi:hypothetical protein